MKKYPVYGVESFNCGSVNSELYVNTFQKHLATHNFVEEPHRHNSHVLVFFTRGSGTHTIDFDSYAVRPGSLFALQPGQIHNWELSFDTEGYVVIYSREIFNLYFARKSSEEYPFYQPAARPEMHFEDKEAHKIIPYFELLISENQHGGTLSTDKILNLLDCILIEMTRKFPASEIHTAHGYNSKIKKFETLLERHYTQEKLPSFYAGQLNITLKHLNRICREILGKTATEIIGNRVVLEAKRMLSGQQLSVNEVADRLGYEDYSYFTRMFKKQTGTTPTAFRKSLLPKA